MIDLDGSTASAPRLRWKENSNVTSTAEVAVPAVKCVRCEQSPNLVGSELVPSTPAIVWFDRIALDLQRFHRRVEWTDLETVVVANVQGRPGRVLITYGASDSLPRLLLGEWALKSLGERWPTPSEAAFDELVVKDVAKLVRWIRADVLSPGHLSLAAESLGAARGRDVLPTLAYLTRSASPLVREGAVCGLGRYGGQDAAQRLQQLAESDTSKAVRTTAREMLEQLEG
jgi:hypothetical protein